MPRRIKRMTLNKVAIKRSDTLINVRGQGSATVGSFPIYVTGVGQRDVFGATQVTKDSADTAGILNIGDVIKYVNLCIQVGNRHEEMGATNPDDNGWLEFSVVWQNQTFVAPAVTNLGLHTLGDISVKQFRGDCIWTGCLPVGQDLPSAVDIKLKLPKKASRIVIGSTLTLFYHFRSVNSTDLRSDSTKVVTSYAYKSYS